METEPPRLLLLDALDELPSDHGEFVLVCGTHAGLDSARKALRRPPRLAVFSDAGVGKDRSGIAGLDLLEAFHIPAAAVDVNSARIGDAADCLENGIISHSNDLARTMGAVPGARVRDVIAKLQD